MDAKLRRHIDRWLAMLLVLGLSVGCGQSNGCSSQEETPYPEEGIRIDRAIQIHLTGQAFDHLEQAMIPMMAGAAGGEGSDGHTLSICMPRTESSGIEICGVKGDGSMSYCDDGVTEGCQLEFYIESMDLIPVDNGPGDASAAIADRLKLAGVISQLDEILPIAGPGVAGVPTTCDLELSLDQADGDKIDFDAQAEFNIDRDTEYLDIDVPSEDINVNLDDMNIEATGVCTLIEIEFIQTLIKTTVDDIIRAQMNPMVESALCVNCAEDEDGNIDPPCPDNGVCDTENGVCRVQGSDQCIKKPLGMEGSIDLAKTMAAYAPSIEGGLSYTIHAANYADAKNQPDDRFSLGMQAGFTSEHNACVPITDPPPSGAMLRSPEIEALTTPSGEPFDLSIGLSKRIVDHALWAFFNAGGLCIEISTATVPQLSSNMVALFLKSMGALTAGKNAPMMLRVQPHQAPEIFYGSGELQDQGNGEVTMIDPLITLVIEDLDIDFYLFSFGRYVRIFTLNTKVNIPLSIDIQDNQLFLLLGESDAFFQQVQVKNNELLTEDAETIKGLIPTLLSAAMPAIEDALAKPIDLPEFGGFKVEIVQATGVGGNTILGIYANFNYVGESTRQSKVETKASLKSFKPFNIETQAKAKAVVDVSKSKGPGALEFSYRVDGGLWSVYRSGPVIEISRPYLWIPGHHKIEVRGRVQGKAQTLDSTPAVIDLEVPKLQPKSLKSMEKKMEGFPDLSEIQTGGCQVNLWSRTESPWILVWIFALWMGWRFRRKWVALGILLFGLSGCGDDTASKEVKNPCEGIENCTPCDASQPCPEGQSCVDGRCQIDGDQAPMCTTASECTHLSCPPNQIAKCLDGDCICGVPCEQGCGDDQYCCFEQDQCIDLPDFCANEDDHLCPRGYKSSLVQPGEPDSNTCTVSEPVCECVENYGVFGIDGSVATHGEAIIAVNYNRSYGDLMLGIAQASGEMAWTFLDGLPEEDKGLNASGPDVGRYTSIAVANDGTVHISYRDNDAKALKYARGIPTGNGAYEWHFHIVDDQGDTGYWTHLSLDPNTEAPRISYVTADLTVDGTHLSVLKFASASTAAPEDASAWQIEDVDQANVDGPCGQCPEGSTCRLDTLECDLPSEEACEGGCEAGKTCFGDGQCAITNVKPKLQDWPYTIGVHATHILDQNGKAVMAYHDGVLGTLKLVAQNADGSWGTPEVLMGDGRGRVGLWPDLAWDDQAHLHMVFVDWSAQTLYYYDVANDVLTPIDDGRRMSGGRLSERVLVGADASLGQDQGHWVVSYQDSSYMDLYTARQKDDGSWETEVIKGLAVGNAYEGAFGFYQEQVWLNSKSYWVSMVIRAADKYFQPQLIESP